MRIRLACLLLTALATGCAEPAATPAHETGVTVHELDFGGERHRLALMLLPSFEARIPSDDGTPYDLELAKEAGYPLRIRGNGTRSVMFLGAGGTGAFATARGATGRKELEAAFPDSGLYFSPQLRAEEAVVGTVFIARVDRGPRTATPVQHVCLLIEAVGDTTVTLRIAPIAFDAPTEAR